MIVLTDWLTVFVVGCFAVMSPGPNFAITLRNSLVHSRKVGVYTAMGLAMGNVVHVTYSLIGIGLIISQSILLFNVIKWLGVLYLLYIGIRSLMAKKTDTVELAGRVSAEMKPIAAIRMGLLTGLLNPKATLFFLALFTQVIEPSTLLPVKGLYGLTVVGIEFVWFSLVAVFISQDVIKQSFQAVAHWVERVTGVVLIALGIKVALSENTH